MNPINLTEGDLQKLNEISELGSQSASESLSIMTNQELSVEISDSQLIPIEKIQNGTESNGIVTAIYLKIVGDLTGEIVCIFPEKSSLKLVDLLLKNPPGTTNKLDDLGISALKETGNILAGNYLSALSNRLGINILESIPDIATDIEEAILNSISLELSRNANETLIFEMNFNVSGETVKGKMVMFFDENSTKKLQKILANE